MYFEKINFLKKLKRNYFLEIMKINDFIINLLKP